MLSTALHQPLHYSYITEQPIAIQITTLQAPLGSWFEPGTAVQNTPVVEYHEIAFGKTCSYCKSRIFQQACERAIGSIERRNSIHRQENRRDRAIVIVHSLHASVTRRLNDRPFGFQVTGRIGISEAYRRGLQHRDRIPIAFPEGFHDGEAVREHTVATHRTSSQAMQQL